MASTQQISQAWAKQDKRRMLHAVYRVGDLDATVSYYKQHFGMKELRSRDQPEKKFKNVFMGYGPEDKNFALELTYNYGTSAYDLGEFGHFGLAVPDVYKTVDSIKSAGGKVSRDAGPVKGGDIVIAFVDDPTGYKFELIERKGESPEPIAQVMLRVTDLDRSIKYYEECLGMKMIRRIENPEYKYTLAFMSYGTEEDSTVIELTHNWGRTEPYAYGEGYSQVAIATQDVHKTSQAIKATGGKILKEPEDVMGTKVMLTCDPDGWKYAFVDEEGFLKELK